MGKFIFVSFLSASPRGCVRISRLTVDQLPVELIGKKHSEVLSRVNKTVASELAVIKIEVPKITTVATCFVNAQGTTNAS